MAAGSIINGAEMAGLEVTITLQDLTVLTGFLTADPIVPQRSSITFNP